MPNRRAVRTWSFVQHRTFNSVCACKQRIPGIKAMLKIPESHCFSMAVGFVYPEIRYQRGVQKEDELKVQIITFNT